MTVPNIADLAYQFFGPPDGGVNADDYYERLAALVADGKTWDDFVTGGARVPWAVLSGVEGDPDVDTTSVAGRTIYTFTGLGAFQIAAGSDGIADVMVVGGGASGGRHASQAYGGGGSGAVVFTKLFLREGAFLVRVGAGGGDLTVTSAPGLFGGPSGVEYVNDEVNPEWEFYPTFVEARGGQPSGGTFVGLDTGGGSTGGGIGGASSGASQVPLRLEAFQSRGGAGAGSATQTNRAGGGGGGAWADGAAASSRNGGAGGAGLTVDFLNFSGTLAGGGGGPGIDSSGAGGTGGGGPGQYGGTTRPTGGSANTGSGGGSTFTSGGTPAPNGLGGSGLVVIGVGV